MIRAAEEKRKALLAEAEGRREQEEKLRAEEMAAQVAKARADARARMAEERKRQEELEVEIGKTMHLLPVEQLGGREVPGFKSMLGYALALLYVARHGLREQERALLWELKHQDEENHNRMSQEEEAEMGLLKLIIDHRLKLSPSSATWTRTTTAPSSAGVPPQHSPPEPRH